MDFSRFRTPDDDPHISYAKAIYSFVKDAEDDLDLECDMYMAVLQKNKDDWSRVVIGSKVGFVPANYISEVSEAEFRSATGMNSNSTNSNDTAYEAIADFTAADESQVSLKSGEVVAVVEKVNDDWWMVRVGGSEGLAPATYLKSSLRKPPPKAPPPQTKDGLDDRKSSSNSFGALSKPIDLSRRPSLAKNSHSQTVSTKKPTAPRAPVAPNFTGKESSTDTDTPLAYISPTEQRRKEEEEHRRSMRKKRTPGMPNIRPESVTTQQLLGDTIQDNQKLKLQLKIAEEALISMSESCSTLSRQISQLSGSRSLSQCKIEFEHLQKFMNNLKSFSSGGLRLSDLTRYANKDEEFTGFS